MGEYWRVETDKELVDCFALLKELKESGPLRIEWRKFCNPRSNSQNNLFHQWCEDIARHWTLHSKSRFGEKATFDKTDVKLAFKRSYGLKGKKYDPVSKKDVPYLVSTADYEVGQMFELMCHMQAFEANAGHILEVKGEFEKNLERAA